MRLFSEFSTTSHGISAALIKRRLLCRKFDKGASTLVPVELSGIPRSPVCPTKSRGWEDYGRHAEGNTSRSAELRRVLHNIARDIVLSSGL